MKAISKRLQKLEQRIPRPAPVYNHSAAAEIQACLTRYGVVHQGMESLADAFARFLGITAIELRTRLQQRVARLRLE
jgi:hypothetical protein